MATLPQKRQRQATNASINKTNSSSIVEAHALPTPRALAALYIKCMFVLLFASVSTLKIWSHLFVNFSLCYYLLQLYFHCQNSCQRGAAFPYRPPLVLKKQNK